MIWNQPPAPLAWSRRIGATTAASDVPFSGFAAAVALDVEPAPASTELAPRATGNGWLCDAERAFETYAGHATLRVRFPGLLSFDLVAGSTLRWHEAPDDPRAAEEALLGAGLVLALAERGTFCLHASAVHASHGGAFVLAGASGAGKSTLAGLLEQEVGWRRLADDITPLEVDTRAATVHPHFPQLKLGPEQAYPDDAPGALPLRGVVELVRGAADARPALERLPSAEAFRTVLARTAAARLFTPELLAAHLKFAECLAARTPLYRLVLPHRPDALEGLARAAAELLECADD